MKNIKVVFMGTPDFSVPVLKMLIDETNVVLVVTQPDKEVGRKKEIKKTPVKVVAEENFIPVFQPSRIRNDFDIIKHLNPDLIVTCAYGQILPEELLNIPRVAAINVHASILPKYRGAAPIQWSILNGDSKTGVTLMYMDKGMDTGDIIVSKEIPILESDDVGTLHDKLSVLGANLLKENLESIINGTNNRVKQSDEDATYARMITREDEHLDFSDTSKNILNKIRALSPWPLANFKLNDVEIKVIKASFKNKNNSVSGVISEISKDTLGIDTIDGTIYLEKIKPFGKKEMDIKDYLNGIDKSSLKGKKVG